MGEIMSEKLGKNLCSTLGAAGMDEKQWSQKRADGDSRT